MKTLTILVAGLAVGWTLPVSAHGVQDTFRKSEHAHALAAELVALTAPHAQCTAIWGRMAGRAMEADVAAEAMIAGLATGDYCAARDAADRLKHLADDLQDDAEELEPFGSPLVAGPRRGDIRRIERFADELEDIAGDLRREVRRLDEGRFAGHGPVPPPVYGRPVPIVPDYGYVPGRPVRPVRPYDGEYLGPPSRSFDSYEVHDNHGGALGPSLTVPPSDAFGPTPTTAPGVSTPVPSQSFYHGATPSADADHLPPGLARKSKLPPGHAKKIEQRRQTGPTLLPPSAGIGPRGYVR